MVTTKSVVAQMLTSDMGQKATFGRGRFTSVQPPTAGIGRLSQYVRKGPRGARFHDLQ